MNSAPQSIPGLRSLYWRDFTIRRAIKTLSFSLMFSAGIFWMSQQVSTVDPEVPSFEAIYGPPVAVGLLVLAALAGVVLVRRYLLVKKILSQGDAVQGIAEEADVFDMNMGGLTKTGQKRPTTYAYYVTIRYAVHGIERKVRIKLPHSPSTYRIYKDREVDLIVLDSLPHKPLIRALYLGPL